MIMYIQHNAAGFLLLLLLLLQPMQTACSSSTIKQRFSQV
jgi:hypothetical protein